MINQQLREAEEKKAEDEGDDTASKNPFADGGDDKGDEEAPEEGGEEKDAGEDEKDTEKKAKPEEPKGIPIKFDISGAKKYNKVGFTSDKGIVKSISKKGVVVTTQPDGVDILVNFDDISEQSNKFFKKNKYMKSIKLSEITKDILQSKKITRLFENLSGEAGSIESKITKLGNELKAAGEDVSDEEIQGYILSALVDADGKIDQVDADDVEKAAQTIKEGRRKYRMKEGHGGASAAIHAIEKVGTILGNKALANTMFKKIEKATGKKVDASKVASGMNKVSGWLKKLTGAVPWAIEKLFGWIFKKFGAGETTQKVAGYSAVTIITVILFIIGTLFFPASGGVMSILLGVTSLLGKGMEIVHLVKEIMHALKKQHGEKGDTEPAPSV